MVTGILGGGTTQNITHFLFFLDEEDGEDETRKNHTQVDLEDANFLPFPTRNFQATPCKWGQLYQGFFCEKKLEQDVKVKPYTTQIPPLTNDVNMFWYGWLIEILHQLRLVVYPIIYNIIGFQHHPNGGWPWDFSHQQNSPPFFVWFYGWDAVGTEVVVYHFQTAKLRGFGGSATCLFYFRII